MSHVFVSYLRTDRDTVDRLVRQLRAAGITVWIDYEQLGPGQRWQRVIKDAIRAGYVFLPCFSRGFTERTSTYMRKELNVAIEELELRAEDASWFMPVTLDGCEVPHIDLGKGQTVRESIYASHLGSDWDGEVQRLIKAIQAVKPPTIRPVDVAATEVVVLDVGGTHMRVARMRDGQFVKQDRRLTREFVEQSSDALVAEIGALASSMGSSPIYGVATSGVVMNGSVYSRNLRLLDWFPMAETLEKRLDAPVAVFNDVRAAAWGEFKRGAGRGTRSMMFLTISTGIGAGFVLNERLYTSPSGLSGEFGQMLTDVGVPIEDIASGRALEQWAPELGFRKPQQLHDGAMSGNKKALSRVRPGLEAIARGIANVHVLLGVEKVILGGSIGRRPDVVKTIAQYVAQLEDLYAVEVVSSTLGDEAGLLGVADLVLQGQLV